MLTRPWSAASDSPPATGAKRIVIWHVFPFSGLMGTGRLQASPVFVKTLFGVPALGVRVILSAAVTLPPVYLSGKVFETDCPEGTVRSRSS